MEIRYEVSTSADLDEIVMLHNQYLNCGDGIRLYIEKSLASEGVIALKALNEAGAIVGILIYTQGIALSNGHGEIREQITGIVKSALVYTGDAILVVHEMRRLGISDKLMEMAREQIIQKARTLRKEEVYVLHELWVYANSKDIPANRVVEKVYGVTHDLGIFEGFYVNFHKRGFICPICGERCVCSARLILSRVFCEDA
jgi:GNAT superfamily N-acetyltransferase